MMKVFIVDDEDILRQGLIYTIDWMALDAVVVGDAPDGRTALERIADTRPDLVLTDIKMPRMDGLALTRALKEAYPEICVVLLTSYADFQYAQEALRLDVFDYLLKPVDEDELTRVMEKLHAFQRERRSRATHPLVEELISSSLLLDGLLQTDNPYVRTIMRTIQSEYRNRLSLEQIAEQEGVSASYLSRKLKEETGQTFNSILARYRLRQSISLLAEGRWRIYEIAEQTGFGDYKHYCQIFKKYLHTTPKNFLRKMQQTGE